MPVGNYSLFSSLGTAFILLPTRYGVLDGVLFDDGQNDMPLDVTVDFIYFKF